MNKRGHFKKNTSAYVYLIGNRQWGYYKIGVSNDAESRATEIERSLPFSIEILTKTYTERPLELEECLHNVFASKSIKNEWFKLSDDDIEHVKALTHVWVKASTDYP